MLEAEREFTCTNSKCKYRFKVYAQLDNMFLLNVPKKCPSNAKLGVYNLNYIYIYIYMYVYIYIYIYLFPSLFYL